MQRLLFLPLLFAQLHAANISWDGGGDGTTWEDPLNWDGDVLPAVGDDVTIDSADDPTVTVANALTLRSLNCEEEITFGGNLTLTGGNSTIRTSTFSDRSISVSGGAVVEFPNITVVAHPANRDSTLQADGVGSRLVFPAALSISGSGGISDDFFLRATNGGQLEFPVATEVTSGAVIFIADGANSQIDLTSLENFTGNLYTTLSGFRAINGGDIQTPVLISITSGEITTDLPGAIDLNALESIEGSGDVTLTGGIHDLSSLTTFSADFFISGGSVPLLTSLADLENSSFALTAGADLELPLVTTLSHNENRDNTISCDGTGTRLSLPNVTTMTGSSGISDDFFLRTTNGGRLELANLTDVVSGAVLFTSDGVSSLIDLTDLESFTGDLYTTSSGFRTTNSGRILTPSLLAITEGEITSDTPGNFDFTLLNTILGNGMVTLTGGVHDLSALTTFKARMTIGNGSVPTLTNLATLENASLFLTGGAILDLPLVTSISHTENRDNTMSADGAGSRLSFPNLTTIIGPNGISDDFFFGATNGGRIDFPMVTDVASGAVLFTADGANSLIDLSALEEFTGNLYTTSSGFRAINGGRIITTSLTSIIDGEFTSDAPGNLDFNQLESYIGTGTLSFSGGNYTLSSLSLYSARISSTGGAVLTFPAVTTISHTANSDKIILADGAGSRISFPNVTTIIGPDGNSDELFITARNGGRVDLPILTEVTSGAVLFTADGTNSLIDLTLLETFTGNLNTTASGFRAINGGNILTPVLTSITGGEITADDPASIDLSLITSITEDGKITLTGGVHDLTSLVTMKARLYVDGLNVPVVTSLSAVDGASFFVSNGAVLNLPLVTSYRQDDNNHNYLRADGVGSELNLPNLTDITSSNSTVRRLYFEAWNGGEINLPSVEFIDNPTTNASLLQFSADGTDSRIDLSSLTTIDPTDAQFFEANGGVIFTPGLNSSNLPDLEVLGLTSSLTNITPGTVVSLTWTVQNSGGVDFNSSRRDSIFLSSNPEGTDATRLSNFNINSLLVPTATESITHNVTIPTTGYSGTVYLIVRVDDARTLIEPDETNNAGSTPALSLPATLTLKVNRNEVSEINDGTARGYLYRNGDPSTPLTVVLSASPSDQVILPASLTFGAGQNTRSFVITPIDDQISDGDSLVTVTAQAAGFASGQDSLLILDGSVPALELSVDNLAPTEGDSITLTIARNKTAGALATTLSASQPNQATFTNTLTFLDGEASISTALNIIDDDTAEQDALLRIVATAAGYLGDSTDLTVIDDDQPSLTLTLNRSAISEAAGPGELLATITRDTSTSEALLVDLTSSSPAAFEATGSIFIPANRTSVSIPLTPVDNDTVEGVRTITLWARSFEANSGDLLTESPVLSLDINDDDGPALSLDFAKKILLEGDTTSITITRNVVDANPLTVTLSHGGDDRVSLTSAITIPANQASTSTILTLTDNGETDGTEDLEAIASATGYASGSSSLTISDETLPELLISRLDAIPEVNTNETGTFSYRISNLGGQATNTPIELQTFLSRDQTIGEGDELIDEYAFEGTIPAGLYFERSGSFIAPLQGGPYFIISRVDPLDTIAEILENNNSSVSNLINVVTAYTATVSTPVNVESSGTPIPLSGSASTLDNSPAAFEIVNIHINLRGTVRIISALTDSNGNFATNFNPLPGEAGAYTIGATHPGNPVATVQDSFTLLGFKSDPGIVAAKLTSNDAQLTGSFALTNLADVTQTGLTFTILDAPAGITGSFVPADGSSLGELAETNVDFTLSASSAVPAGTYNASLRIESSEGGLRQIALDLTVCQNTSELRVDNLPILRGMVGGEQSFINFTVRNTGGAPTGPLHLVLPNVPWLSSAVQSPLPSLAPDERATISLQLCPADNLALGTYTGSLVLRADDSSLSVPYQIRNLSLAKGDLTVNCEDEYTYFAQGQPPLAGALVRVIDTLSNSVVAEGTSDASGQASFANLTEGYYEVIVSAEKHAAFRDIVFIDPGETNTVRAFLQRTTVEYVWNVVPTSIEDEYRIVIETVFETNVPVPVITIEPAHIDLSAITQEVTNIDITITNHGLIGVEGLSASFDSTTDWQMLSIAEDLGTLPAKSSITIPVTVVDLNYDSSRTFGRAGGCPGGRIRWNYECGDTYIRSGAGLSSSGGGCGGSGNGGSAFPGGGVPNGGGINPRPSGSNTPCDPCLAEAIGECILSFVPGADLPLCVRGAANAAASNDPVEAAQAALSCACALVDLVPPAGVACNLINCYIDILQCTQGEGGAGGGAGGGASRASVLGTPAFGAFDQAGRDLMTYRDLLMVTYDDPAWVEYLTTDELGLLAESLIPSFEADSESGGLISTSERAAALATPLGTSETALVNTLIDRLNRTRTYYAAGIYEIEDLDPGMNDDFATRSATQAAGTAYLAALDRALAAGYGGIIEAYLAKQTELFNYLTVGGGVCAKVRLRIEQEAVMTRDAFEASLEILNNDPAPLENLNISISIIDANGADQSALFGIDGNGASNATLNGETNGNWSWTIIPTSLAAPTGPVEYFVKGTVSFMQGDFLVETPLAPQNITVQPNPSLKLKYFHERDVFSDDPDTDIIEPSIPFSLGVMVQNQGAGLARNLRITSAQPVIVDNEKGLFIDFDIIASEVSGQNLTPSLTANFGDIQPGEVKIGQWLMKSSLQGLFTEYEASFEHLNSLDDERLSLIEEVTIHETIQTVSAPGTFQDNLPDFLVNDIPDFGDTADTVHLSDGTTAPVTYIPGGTATTPNPLQLEVTLTIDTPSGFLYAKIDDPGNGNFRLVDVVRSDGRILPLDVNAWTTDRTFLGLGLKPVRENKLHLFDHDTTGSYTLTYVAIPPADTEAPSSSVAMLPVANSGFFSVDWSGTDNTAITGYDIFVSENSGPFTLWLKNSNGTSALFEGTFGNDYAFHSIASDAAGNNEAPKSTGEASTSVSLVNQAPVLDVIADTSITEGQTLQITASANDPDGPDSSLRYSLACDDPGMTINAVSGRIRWITNENNGGQTVAVTVTVTDGSSPPLSTSSLFNVTVIDDNKAPSLVPFDSVVLEIGEEFTVTAIGTDPDAPAQVLTYEILSEIPTGLTLDPTTGEIEWTPLESQGDQSFAIQVAVSDDQTPPLSASRTLLVEVLVDPGLPPVFDPFPAQIWTTATTQFLDLHAEDPEGESISFTANLTGLPGALLLEQPGTPGDARLHWQTFDVPPGVYTIPVTASTDRQSTTALITIEIQALASFFDYQGWINAYMIPAGQQGQSSESPGVGIPNLLTYALGIDPIGGISPAQAEPRPVVIISATTSELCFQLPSGGRPDLRYTVQTTTDLVTWETVGTKEGNLPWSEGSVVTEEIVSPNLSIIKVVHDEGMDDDNRRFMRLIVQVVE